jgi:hypothetical protein
MLIKMASGSFTEGHEKCFYKGQSPLRSRFSLGKLADAN